nr:hypothetical protein [Tanacetum cinerariifolium]
GDVGADPIVVAVLAAVFHHAHPGFALLDGLPHVGEHGGWHVRVADQVVWLADQLLAGKTAEGDKGVIAVGDMAAEVSGGDEALAGGKGTFLLCDGHVQTHKTTLP